MSMKSKPIRRLVRGPVRALLGGGALLALGSAGAQQVNEMIVTVQKRTENLQDVPVSVTAFSAESIRELTVVNSTDIAAHTPNLNIGTPVGEGNNPSIVMRGVGLNDFNDNNESNVAMYIDDVYRAALAGQTFQLFDLERVEVLRGPQGTLYGRNTTGGLVHFISKKPTEEFDAYADLIYGYKSQMKGEGAIGGGTDTVKVRVAASFNEADGYVRNRIGKDPNEASSRAWRAQLQLDPTDKVSALLNFHGSDSNPLAPAYQHEGTAGGGLDVFGYQDTDGDPWTGDYDRTGPLDIENFGTTFTLNVDLDSDLDLTWITGTERVTKFHQEDTDMQGSPWVEPTFEAESDQVTSELRLAGSNDRSNWVVGLYYFDYDVDSDSTQLDLSNSAGVTLDVDYSQRGDSWAAFGQYEYEITDEWEVLFGLRYTSEDKDYEYFQNESFIPLGLVYDFSSATAGDLANIDDENLSGKVTVNYRPADDVLFFGSVSRGFKSGGFNAGFLEAFAPPVPLSEVPFQEEELTAYEIGAKTDWLDGKLRLNTTVFYYDYEDLQALTFVGVSQFISNAEGADIYGAEIEAIYQPIERLRLQAGLGLLDTDADGISDPAGGGAVLDGRELVLSPDVTFDGLVNYDLALPGLGNDLNLQVDFTYRSDHYFDIVNQPVSRQDDYWVFNARAAYKLDEHFEVAAFGKNLFEEEYKVYTFDFSKFFGFNQQFYAPPRWWGVEFRYQY